MSSIKRVVPKKRERFVYDPEEYKRKSRGMFGNLEFFKRKDLIKPYIHELDERGLRLSLNEYFGNPNFLSLQNLEKLYKAYPELKLDKDKVVSGAFYGEFTKIWYDLPKELSMDVFNLLYVDIRKLDFEERNKANHSRYRILDKAMDPMLPLVCNNNPVKSMIMTRSFMQYITTVLTLLKLSDPDNFKDLMDQLNSVGQKSTQKADSSSTQSGQGQGDPGKKSGSGSGEIDEQEQEDASQNQGNGSSESEQDSDGDKDDDQNGGDAGNGSVKENIQGVSQKADGQVVSQHDLQQILDQAGNDLKQGTSGPSSAGNGNTKKADLKTQFEKLVTRFLETPDRATKKQFDDTMNEGKKMVKSFDESYSEKDAKDTWDTLSSNKRDSKTQQDQQKALLSLNQGALDAIQEQLRTIKMSMDKLTHKIKHLLDKSVAFFSSREKTTYEPLLDSDSWDGLSDWELLHPKLRKVMIEDIVIKEVKKMGKINAYIDVSGSMGGSSGVSDSNGRSISRLTFAKAMVYKMKEMNLLNKVFSFEDSVHPQGNSMKDILSIDGSGGTSLNNVVRHIQLHQENAIVITDAEDRVNLYSENAFFVGVLGARFGSFDRAIAEAYIDKNQLVVFDGNVIKDITLRDL